MRQLSLTHTIDGGAAGSNKLAAGTNGNNGTKRLRLRVVRRALTNGISPALTNGISPALTNGISPVQNTGMVFL